MKKALLILAGILSLVALLPAASSFTPLAQVAATASTYTDSAPVDGSTYTYIVTEYAPACPATPLCGESTFTAQFTVTIPATGTHTVSLSWTPSGQSGVTGQNVYRFATPAPDTGLSATVN